MVLADLRYVCRSLLGHPLWTLAAVLCLAIGTGANTASLSVINAILLRPLPFADAHELAVVGLRETDPPRNRVFSLTEFREIEPRARLFRHLSARTFLPVSVSAGDRARMVQAELVSRNYFDMLQVRPLAGRLPAGQSEAMLSERLWRGRFASNPGIIERTIRVNSRQVTVSGIAPAGFVGATQLISADMWLPADFAGSNTPPHFGVIGRLQPGATREQARLQLNAILSGMEQTQGSVSKAVARVEAATGFGFPVVARPAAGLLFGLIGSVMGVAIANVAALMLARAPGRSREIGMRLALGASPGRVMRLILVESLVLSLVGSAIGAIVASALMHALPALGGQLPEHLTYALDVRIDVQVLLYAALAAIIASILFGLLPARQTARTNLMDVLKQTGARSATVRSARALNALVIGQMAISTALLVSSGLLARSYVSAQNADPGIDATNVLVVSLDLDQARYDAVSGLQFYQRLLRRVAALPGVEVACITSDVPLAPRATSLSVIVESPDGQRSADSLTVTPGYFTTLRIPLLHGRDFVQTDRRAAIVNQTMAVQFWPARTPVGHTFRVGGTLLEVLGVVKDVKQRSLTEMPRPAFYRPLEQYAPRMSLVVRSPDAVALLDPVRRMIQSDNPDLSLVDARSMESILNSAIAPRRQAAQILAVVCGLGLFLSAAGLYGVIAFGVRERTRELGVRIALGARPRDIAGLVLHRGLRLALAGFAVGLLVSFGLIRLLAAMISGVGSPDTSTSGFVCCVLLLVALAASYFPARWAIHIDPAAVLRGE